jgi:hypothetical protein
VAYVANAQPDSARQLLSELIARSRSEHVNAAGVALLYDALGNREEALRWLARGVAQYDPLYTYTRGVLFDRLRSDPRGATLLAKIESPNTDLPPINSK